MKNIKIKQIADTAREKVDIISFFENKISVFQDMILSTILMVQKYKTLNIFGARELNICIQGLDSIFQDLKNIQITISQKKLNTDDVLSRLQAVNNELSQIFRSFGTTHITDLVSICFGFDLVFLWGNHQFKHLKTSRTNFVTDRSFSSGHPRFDLLKENLSEGYQFLANQILGNI